MGRGKFGPWIHSLALLPCLLGTRSVRQETTLWEEQLPILYILWWFSSKPLFSVFLKGLDIISRCDFWCHGFIDSNMISHISHGIHGTRTFCLHFHFHGAFLKMIAAILYQSWTGILWWVWIDMVHGSEFPNHRLDGAKTQSIIR